MYFIAIHSINIIHFVIIIIFMAQLLFPKMISFISKYLMAILQILFFSELVLDILNHYFNDYFIKNENLIKLIMEYDAFSSKNSIEIDVLDDIDPLIVFFIGLTMLLGSF